MQSSIPSSKYDISQEEQLLASLVESQQLGPALKSIFDRSWQSTYEKKLIAHINKKENEVKNICHSHYEEFISCIDNIITVKDDLQNLKDKIKLDEEELEYSAENVLAEAEELISYRERRHNMNIALDTAAKCAFVLGLAVKAQEQIEYKKYFSALKTLDQLSRHHLPQFANYSFTQQLNEQIPKMMMKIRDSVKTEFITWLFSIKESTKELGAVVMTQTQDIMKIDEKKKRARVKQQAYLSQQAGSPGIVDESAMQIAFKESEDIDFKKNQSATMPEKIKIDFSPVYQCLHIYESLDMADHFKSLYKDSRRTMAAQIVDGPANASNDFLTNYHSYFAQLAGFFAVEDSVLRSGNELLSRSEVEQLWDHCSAKLKLLLREQLNSLLDPSKYLEIKKFVILFSKTIEGYGLPVSSLYEFLSNMRERFEQLLFARLHNELRSIFSREKFEPLTIDEPEEYNKFVVAYSLMDSTVNTQFPVTLPFSLSCPLICRAMRNFIYDYYQFAEYLPDMEMTIRKAVDIALIQEVNAALTHVLDESGINQIHISQPSQISVNAEHLLSACNFFETYVTSFGDPRYLKVFKLSARDTFQLTKMRCIDLIMELIDSKIDMFMSLTGNMDGDPDFKQEQPSDYILDLIAYLTTTFSCMQFMPEGFRQAIHFTSCKHISDNYVSLLANGLKRFNIVAIYNINMDVEALEDFARSCPIAELETKFAEIRQILSLFLSGNVEQILDHPIRQSRFAQVNLNRLVLIMDKYREIGMFSRWPDGLPKLKRTPVENVARALRE